MDLVDYEASLPSDEDNSIICEVHAKLLEIEQLILDIEIEEHYEM